MVSVTELVAQAQAAAAATAAQAAAAAAALPSNLPTPQAPPAAQAPPTELKRTAPDEQIDAAIRAQTQAKMQQAQADAILAAQQQHVQALQMQGQLAQVQGQPQLQPPPPPPASNLTMQDAYALQQGQGQGQPQASSLVNNLLNNAQPAQSAQPMVSMTPEQYERWKAFEKFAEEKGTDPHILSENALRTAAEAKMKEQQEQERLRVEKETKEAEAATKVREVIEQIIKKYGTNIRVSSLLNSHLSDFEALLKNAATAPATSLAPYTQLLQVNASLEEESLKQQTEMAFKQYQAQHEQERLKAEEARQRQEALENAKRLQSSHLNPSLTGGMAAAPNGQGQWLMSSGPRGFLPGASAGGANLNLATPTFSPNVGVNASNGFAAQPQVPQPKPETPFLFSAGPRALGQANAVAAQHQQFSSAPSASQPSSSHSRVRELMAYAPNTHVNASDYGQSQNQNQPQQAGQPSGQPPKGQKYPYFRGDGVLVLNPGPRAPDGSYPCPGIMTREVMEAFEQLRSGFGDQKNLSDLQTHPGAQRLRKLEEQSPGLVDALRCAAKQRGDGLVVSSELRKRHERYGGFNFTYPNNTSHYEPYNPNRPPSIVAPVYGHLPAKTQFWTPPASAAS